MPTPTISTTSLHFDWPDGTPVLAGLDLSLGLGVHGLVGHNGTGKSTLLRLLAGQLAPSRGAVSAPGAGLLDQDLTVEPSRRVADVLGVGPTLDALRRIEAGSVAETDFDTVGEDWDVTARCQAELARLGLDGIDLDRRVGSLSGGELELLALTSLLLTGPQTLLLDEPTNNLDHHARERLTGWLGSWRGTVLLVSHDRDLLETVDDIGELHRTGADSSRGVGGSRISWYGGGLTAFEQALAGEQQAAERAVGHAEQRLRSERRDQRQAQQTLAQRRSVGRRAEREKRVPGVVIGERKRSAQVSAARYADLHADRVEEAAQALDEAGQRVRAEPEIDVDLPRTVVPPRRQVLTLTAVRPAHTRFSLDLSLRGPERVALRGRNGVGKTALLRTLTGTPPVSGEVEVHVPLGLLPQHGRLLDDRLSVVAAVARHAPSRPEPEIRSRLARFLIRGRDADQPAGTLSGGERLRATLAGLLLAEPAPQLLVLDEPTNHLDLASTQQLVEALRGYRGALLVVSHDARFLDDLGAERVIDLDQLTPP